MPPSRPTPRPPSFRPCVPVESVQQVRCPLQWTWLGCLLDSCRVGTSPAPSSALGFCSSKGERSHQRLSSTGWESYWPLLQHLPSVSPSGTKCLYLLWGLNENVPHKLIYLKIWPPVGASFGVHGELRGVSLGVQFEVSKAHAHAIPC